MFLATICFIVPIRIANYLYVSVVSALQKPIQIADYPAYGIAEVFYAVVECASSFSMNLHYEYASVCCSS